MEIKLLPYNIYLEVIIVHDAQPKIYVMLHIQVVKVADFGVARVKAQTGVMTAETGTYRWMAPEVPNYSYQAL